MARGVVSGTTLVVLPALAVDFSFSSEKLGDFQFNLDSRLTVGAAVRAEGHNYNLIDKQNVPGQSTLCANPAPSPVDGQYLNGDCMSLGGDPSASQVLIRARGGYNINGDDGDLNYNAGDVTAAGASLRSTLSGGWRNFTFKIGGIGIYDPFNSHFNTHSSDLEYSGRSPLANAPDDDTVLLQRQTRRRSDLETDTGRRLQLLEAFVAGDFTLPNEHKLRLAIGKQYLRWGESTFTLFNNLNQINPLSAPLYRFPGAEVKDAYLPTNMISASYDLAPKLTLSGFYQLTWEATQPDVAGSYLSVSDVAGGGDGPTPIYISQGQFPEDPLAQNLPSATYGAYTLSPRTVYLEDEHYGDPHNGGQFGFRLDYYADWLNGGTELSLYGSNLHSRLPYLSAHASQQSCFDAAAFYQSGFSGAFAPCYAKYGIDPNTAEGYDQVRRVSFPTDTARPFLDYPEDIHTFGASFNTSVGAWSLAGEVAYSPNQPAQVSVVDVLYAAEQPGLPDTPEGYAYGEGNPTPGQAGGRGLFGSGIIVPTNRVYIPDYLETTYRNHRVQAGDYVQGYERLQVAQISLTGIRIFSGSNFIHADQILFVGELAALKVFNMPSLDRLQFESFTGRELHYSVGQADFDPNAPGAGTAANGYTDGVIGPLDVANTERASAKDFADDFAWGYRLRLNATYNDVWRRIGLTPGVELYHDVQGTSISPGQDFVEGRIQATFSNEFKFSQNFSALARYVLFAGGGYRNLREDRDYAELSATYSF